MFLEEVFPNDFLVLGKDRYSEINAKTEDGGVTVKNIYSTKESSVAQR